MKGNRQTTLFQSWGNQKKESVKGSSIEERPTVKASTSTNDDVIDLCESFDDDDDGLLYQAEETLNFEVNNRNESDELDGERFRHDDEAAEDEITAEENECNISVGAENFTLTQKQTQGRNLPGFDICAGKLWIYPTNYTVRDYQYNIVHQALFKNTMVTLPTGLGKTFIAAVVMYNFYRWYPQGKVVFMAPTKPLVAQQIEACYNIMGIPQDHTAEMTGSMGPPKREKAWHEKRVFFLTPQVLTNDLSRGSCPAEDVKCLVIDEAHKALGNHAYCQVVRELVKYTENFRVLALSATPGSDIKAVQQVLTNLLISHIEIRTEESIDIKQYSHERKVDKVVVPLGEELTRIKEKYTRIVDIVVSRLKREGVLYNRDTTSLSKFLILKSREAFRQNPPERLPRSQYGVVEGDFALAMSLYHGYELLQLHGSRSLYNFLEGILTGDKGYGRTRAELTKNGDFNELMEMLTEKYNVTPSEATSNTQANKPFVIGHPKMERLQEIVLEHFANFSDPGTSATRVMIFSQYRDSVKEITDMLNVHNPMVKVMSFIGQSSAGKATKGFTQKEQLKVMKQFREGGYNTLVSTCVGEEGLDIGDVDLIICFDAHKSPIRLVQRMGRTGRKREGRIVMLVTQGKEEQIYNQSQYSKKSIHKAILNGARSLHFYQHSPRMIPEHLSPKPHKMHITVKESFKPTKRITTESKTDQSKITSLFDNGKKDDKEESLSREQYQELQDWFVDDSEVPKLPEPETVCLTKGNEGETEVEPVGTQLSLTDWSPWQNTLQPFEKFGHSVGSRHLVQLMEFVQLQYSLDPGDDPYGIEMASYLNEDDLLNPGETETNPASILKYCVSKKVETFNEGRKGKRKFQSKMRRSDTLPNFEDYNKNYQSDDDLPAFKLSPQKKDKFEKERITVEKHNEDQDGEVSLSLQNLAGNNVNNCSKTSAVAEAVTNNQVTTTKKKVIGSRAKSLERKMNESILRKAKKRKRSRNSLDCRTVVELIADNDSNDFDDEESSAPDEGKFAQISMVHNERAQIGELDKNLEQNNKLLNYADISVDASFDTESVETKHYKISSAPSTDEAVSLCKGLDETAFLDRIDLIQLVDDWEKENGFKKYIVKHENFTTIDDRNAYNYQSLNGCEPNQRHICSILNQEKIEFDKTKVDVNNISVTDNTNMHSIFCSDSSLKLVTANENEDEENILDNSDNIHCKKVSEMDIEIPYHEVCNISETVSEEQPIVKTKIIMKGKHPDESNGSKSFHMSSNQFPTVDNEVSANVKPLDSVLPVKERASSVLGGMAFAEMEHKDNSWLADRVDEELADLLRTQKTCVKNIKGMETGTQVTFTQALACVHSSTGSESDSVDRAQHSQNLKIIKSVQDEQIISRAAKNNSRLKQDSEDDQKSKGERDLAVEEPKHLRDEFENQVLLSDGVTDVMSPQKEVQQHNSSELVARRLSEVRSKDSVLKGIENAMASFEQGILSDSDEIDVPQFDLGFDIDEDIIPPSPNASQQSHKSVPGCISQTFSSSLRMSQSKLSLAFNNHDQQNTINNVSKNSNNCKQLESALQNITKPMRLSLGKREFKHEKENDSSMHIQKKIDTKAKYGLHSVPECKTAEEEIVPLNGKIETKSNECNIDLKITGNENPPECESDRNTNTIVLTQADLQRSLSPVAEPSFCLMDDNDLSDWFDSEPEENESLQDPEKAGQVSRNLQEKHPQQLETLVKHEMVKSRVSLDNIMNKTANKDFVTNAVKQGKETNTIDNIPSVNETKQNDYELLKKAASELMTPINKLKNRKSVFAIDDFSPDPFNDSFDFNTNDFTKITSPASLKTNAKSSLSSSTPKQTLEKNHLTRLNTDSKSTPAKSPVDFAGGLSQQRSNYHSESESDDSFIVRKKKKPCIIESPCSQICKVKETFDCLNQNLFKTPYKDEPMKGIENKNNNLGRKPLKTDNLLEKKRSINFVGNDDDDDFDDTVMLKKQNYILPKSKFIVNECSSDEDFDEPVIKKKNLDTVRPVSEHGAQHCSPPCKTRKTRSSNPFIEEEAELSEDGADEASSDENEDALDRYEASFIQDTEHFSQSQALDNTEMQAIYMKSIKSPTNGPSRYKLQYDYKDINVFSQIPEEESQYMEDSFCVGEEDEWLGCLEEKLEPVEVTVLKPEVTLLKTGRTRRERGGTKVFETGRERTLHQGRMRALDKIKSKMAMKSNNMPKRRSVEERPQKFPKKNRIQVFDDSSPEDNFKKSRTESSDLNSPEVIKVKKKTRLAIVSSSDEEDGNTFAEVKSADNKKDAVSYDDNENGRLTKLKAKTGDVKQTSSDADLLIFGTKKSKTDSKAVILVDSREISGSQDIISDLRFQHGIHVTSAQLPGCDYIISNRMAVERKQWSEFSNGANRTKLTERIQALNELYDRPVLIIEKDRVKPGEEKCARPVHWTKYVDKTIALLLKSEIKILYTDCQKETAVLLADLCQLEKRKGMDITAQVDLNTDQQSKVKFFATIPKLSYIHALNLSSGFKSVSEFMKSSIQMIQTKGQMSENRAVGVYKFLRRQFDPSMLST